MFVYGINNKNDSNNKGVNMTTGEAKKDLAKKLSDLRIPFEKLTARTISFQGFGYGNALFVSVHGAIWRRDANLGTIKSSLTLKPSEGFTFLPKTTPTT